MTRPTETQLRANIDAHIAEMQKQPVVKHDWQVKNCITYWYPKLLSTIVRMPETLIIRPDVGLYEFYDLFEPRRPPNITRKFEELCDAVRHACTRIGYPAFLRTGTTSGKHDWEDTCYLTCDADIPGHLRALIGDAAMKDQCLDVFAVREMLPTEPEFYAFRGKMPITRERRLFVRDGRVIGSVPYWPEGAFVGQWTSTPDWRPIIQRLSEEPDLPALEHQTLFAAFALEGEWSIDWLWTRRGWYLTDCALGPMSYGWDLVCPPAGTPEGR